MSVQRVLRAPTDWPTEEQMAACLLTRTAINKTKLRKEIEQVLFRFPDTETIKEEVKRAEELHLTERERKVIFDYIYDDKNYWTHRMRITRRAIKIYKNTVLAGIDLTWGDMFAV